MYIPLFHRVAICFNLLREDSVVQQATTRPVAHTRRSTRVAQAIPLTVMGVDAWRGPYREQVSTLSINCHGCKYQSKYQVTKDSLVIFELASSTENQNPHAVRGHVKWVRRPGNSSELFETAVELEVPGNVWGVDSPPEDWFPFSQSKTLDVPANGGKTMSAARTAPAVVASKSNEKLGQLTRPVGVEVAPSAVQPVARLMGEFQGQIQRMLSEAATAAVAEKSGPMLIELRKQIQSEAKETLEGLAASCADHLVRRSVEQMSDAHQRSAEALHDEWVKKIQADLRRASEGLEIRSSELKQVAESVAVSATERLQRVAEAAQRDGVSRFVARLQQQLGPLLEYAQKASTDLAKRKEELESNLQKIARESAARMQQACDQLQKQFEQAIRDQLAKAQEELGRTRNVSAQATLKGFQQVYENYEKQAQNSLRVSLDPVLQQAVNGLKEKATEISKQFAAEMDGYTRTRLEQISGAIAELAKGLGKRPGV